MNKIYMGHGVSLPDKNEQIDESLKRYTVTEKVTSKNSN